MTKLIDTLLLLALPASGKSEVRKYLDGLSPEQCRDEFHSGHTVQLDDFPYVHLMRRVDEEAARLDQPRLFFKGDDRPFQDPVDWGTLIQLVNEDYADLISCQAPPAPEAPAEHLFQRLDRARQRAGGEAKLAPLAGSVRARLAEALADEAAEMLKEQRENIPASLEGKTIVIEFARGGADGSTMPLPAHMGYQHSLSQLSEEILNRSSVLYIWVTPEESRRKNDARADPDDPGSILHHGVPLEVMMGDYGCDDIDYLISQSDKPCTVLVEAHGKTYHLPIGRFDNRVDKTSFIHGDRDTWKAEDVDALHAGLKLAFDELARNL